MKTETDKAGRLLEIVLEGDPVVVGEYRGVKVDVRQSVDKTTGNAKTTAVACHLVQTGSGNNINVVRLNEWFDDPAQAEGYQSPWQAGRRYAFTLRRLECEKGQMSGAMATKVYAACRAALGWEGRKWFRERMEMVRRLVNLTIEGGWEAGLGPRGKGYGSFLGFVVNWCIPEPWARALGR